MNATSMSEAGSARLPACHTLDVGCGRYKLPFAIGVDKYQWPEVDIIHDLDKYPWPFNDNSFQRLICRHSLAHLWDVVAAMEEIYRITCPGGIVEIVSPHFSSDNAFTDVTTRSFFGHRSMDYFCVDRPMRYRYGLCQFRLLDVRISFLEAHSFEGAHKKFNPLAFVGLEWVVNRFPRTYEHFFSFILRANEVYYRLEVLK